LTAVAKRAIKKRGVATVDGLETIAPVPFGLRMGNSTPRTHPHERLFVKAQQQFKSSTSEKRRQIQSNDKVGCSLRIEARFV